MLPPKPAAFVLASTHHGTMILNRNDYNSTPDGIHYGVGWQLLNHSSFDHSEVALALDLLRSRRDHFGDGVVALDCGANIGVHVVEWSRLMHNWGSVTAFEAQERIFYALAGNLAINNCLNARAIWSAIGKNEGMIGVPQPDYNHPASYGSLEIRQNHDTEFIGQPIQYNESALIPTKMISIDSLNLSRLDFIKIDIEGMEIEALRGGRKTLETCKPIILIEWIKSDLTALSYVLESLQYKLFKADYNLLAIHATDPVLQTFTSLDGRKLHRPNHAGNRPVFLMAPLSRLGLAFGAGIAQRYGQVIAAIHDEPTTPVIHGTPCWSSSQFLEQAKQYPDAIAIDLSVSQQARAWFAGMCAETSVEHYDWGVCLTPD
ncbi:FkbM family methyltransferase [Methylobacillus pratensis]